MTFKFRFIVIAAGAMALLAATGWIASRSKPVPRRDQTLHAIVDMTGQTVHSPVNPMRTLSLCTLATDAMVHLGAADRLVAIDEFSQIVPGAQNAIVIGKGSDVSREKVLSLNIDLAFIWWYQDDVAAMMKDLNIPAIRIRSGRANELPDAIRLIGQCLNLQPQAENQASEVETFLSSEKSTADSPAQKVFLELYGPFKTVGKGTYANDLLELAGLSNIAADAEGNFVLSAERLVQADPDILLCIGADADAIALSRRPGIGELKAARNGKVIALNRYWLVAGPNLPQSVENIRSAISQTLKP